MSHIPYGENGDFHYLRALLSFSYRTDPDPIAESLVRKYGSIDRAASAPIEELSAMPEMNQNAIMLLKLTAALNSRRVTDSVKPGDVLSEEELKRYLVALYLGISVETVYLLLFDREGRLISTEYMGEGTVSGSDVYPRRLLECAVRHSAARVILVHNHPRGSADPSRIDVNATSNLKAIFRNVGIDLSHHYIVSDRKVALIPSEIR